MAVEEKAEKRWVTPAGWRISQLDIGRFERSAEIGWSSVDSRVTNLTTIAAHQMNYRATGEIFADLLGNPEQGISRNMIIVAGSLSGWVTAKKIELTSDCSIEEGVKFPRAQIKHFSMCSIVISICWSSD